MTNKFYNVKEVALLLGLQPPAVRALIRANKIKASKFNNTYLINETDLNEILKDRGLKNGK